MLSSADMRKNVNYFKALGGRKGIYKKSCLFLSFGEKA